MEYEAPLTLRTHGCERHDPHHTVLGHTDVNGATFILGSNLNSSAPDSQRQQTSKSKCEKDYWVFHLVHSCLRSHGPISPRGPRKTNNSSNLGSVCLPAFPSRSTPVCVWNVLTLRSVFPARKVQFVACHDKLKLIEQRAA